MHIDEPVDYIVHGAGVTTSRLFVTHPVETIETAAVGRALRSFSSPPKNRFAAWCTWSSMDASA